LSVKAITKSATEISGWLPDRFPLDNLRERWYPIRTGGWIQFPVFFSDIESMEVTKVEETVQPAEQKQNVPVAKREYGKPQLMVYEDLQTVTGVS
jgi:hypothetical protein